MRDIAFKYTVNNIWKLQLKEMPICKVSSLKMQTTLKFSKAITGRHIYFFSYLRRVNAALINHSNFGAKEILAYFIVKRLVFI